jgi:hypothetical protein
MYSYEDRIRAVELYIKLGKRVRPTIRQLGYAERAPLSNGSAHKYNVRPLSNRFKNRWIFFLVDRLMVAWYGPRMRNLGGAFYGFSVFVLHR